MGVIHRMFRNSSAYAGTFNDNGQRNPWRICCTCGGEFNPSAKGETGDTKQCRRCKDAIERLRETAGDRVREGAVS